MFYLKKSMDDKRIKKWRLEEEDRVFEEQRKDMYDM
jgi:hypothetical protein